MSVKPKFGSIEGDSCPTTTEGALNMLPIDRRLQPYHLTTAEITYHLPDYPELLQNYIWQDFDLVPEFPVLRRFIDFWQRNLDGRVHSVAVAASALVRPPEVRFGQTMLTLQ